MSQSNESPTASSPPPTDKGRIPLVLTPIHYDLWYQRFCLETFRFEGVVTIRCHRHRCDDDNNNKEQPFQSVAVHAADLQLTKAELRVVKRGNDNGGDDDDDDDEDAIASKGGVVHRAVEFRHNVKEQVCEIRFDRPIKEDPIKDNEGKSSSLQVFMLTIHFAGCLNDQMRGLYRSSYESLDSGKKKKKKWILTTQMEPTDARRAFPCFDEPALKATFALKCTVPYKMQCLSNTPILSSHTCTTTTTAGTPSSLVKTVTFQTTPKMSTYLVALIVGQFDSISQASNNDKSPAGTANAVTTTVYTVPGKAHQAEFCLDTAAQCLQLFQELFQIPYPLPKSDLVAIPDFAAGYELHCVCCAGDCCEWFSHHGGNVVTYTS
jgi:Peptidase M1 N-terminal domain